MNAVQLATFPTEARPRHDSGHGVRRVRQRGAPGATSRRRRQRPQQQMGDFGFSLKKIIGKGPSIKGIKSSIKGTVHTAGKVLDNKLVKGALATGLALTGVGVPLAAGIMAAEGAAGGAMKKGGGLKKAVKGAATGAVVGAGAGVAGKVLTKLPGIGSQVLKLRQKIGTAPQSIAPSYDSSNRLDQLATGVIPDVSTVATAPTMDMPLLDPITQIAAPVSIASLPVVAPLLPAIAPKAAQMIAKRKRKEAEVLDKKASNEGAKGNKQKMLDFMKKAGKKVAEASGIDMATNLTVPPSADPSVPQGGFPAVPYSTSGVPDTTEATTNGAPAQASMGGGIGELFKNPIAVVGIAAALFFLTQKRR